MHLIDTNVLLPEGTWRYKFIKWFCDNINFCHGYRYAEYDEEGNPVAKPDNKLYDFLYRYWLFPFKQNDCICCNTVRGLVYGFVIGLVLGWLL